MQNARRAGATRIDITVDDKTVTVKDDGSGIDDPAVLLNFGRSNWTPEILKRETPAGMGLASLARRTSTIETRPPGAATEDGWSVTLTPAHWRGEMPATVEPKTVAEGTTVTFELLPSDRYPMEDVLKHAAEYHPLPVTVNGEAAVRTGFLADCVDVEEFPGGRIGAAEKLDIDSINYNFHGVRAEGPGTTVSGYVVSAGIGKVEYHAKFDIDDNQGIELVLPARRAVVSDEKTHKLVARANTFLWKTLLKKHPGILVTAEDRRRIEALGLPAPEEPPRRLTPWKPDRSDWELTGRNPEEDINPGGPGPWIMVCSDSMEPRDQAVVKRALDQAGLASAVFEPNSFLDGYGWYDRLPQIRGVDIRVVTEHGTTDLQKIRDVRSETSQAWYRNKAEVLKVEVALRIEGADGPTLETDMVFIEEDDSWEPDLRVTPDSKLRVGELADLIFDSCFSPSDDIESDSYETQKQEYRDAARHMALSTLESNDAADEQALLTNLERAMECRLTHGQRVTVTPVENGYDIRIAREAAP